MRGAKGGTRAKGFGLVELMIAVTLGVSLSAAVLQATLASHRSQRLLDASARLQESGRFALNYLARDLRTAGFMGCPNLSLIPVNVIAKATPDDFDFTLSGVLKGFDNVAAGNDYAALAGSDVVVMQRAALPMTRLTGNLSPDNANIQIESNPAGLERNDFVFITDCTSADLFQATSVSNNNSHGGDITIAHGRSNNYENRLSKVYGKDAVIMGFQSVAYFVRDSGRDTADGHDIHSLYVLARRFGTTTPLVAQELVEGVENMQITYGVDQSDDRNVDVYQSANNVGDWSRVMSVRLELLLHSTEGNVVPGSGDYAQRNLVFNGATVPPDGRFRKVYRTAVAIRNRLP